MAAHSEPFDATTATDQDVLAFGAAVERALGVRPPPRDLVAALRSVAFREKQAGSKLSPVHQPARRADGSRTGPQPVPPYCAATFASFATCPSTCTFLTDPITGGRRGCFVGANVNSMRLMHRLDASAAVVDPRLRGTLIGLAEAYLIDRAFPDGVPQDGPRHGGRILRVHVAGDAANTIVVEALAAAAARWRARGGGPVWCYTHRWRSIPRSAWGSISIFASVETSEAAEAAMARGYAVAMTVDAFAAPRAYALAPGGARVLPCPTDVERVHADGRPVTCASCGWCFDDHNLLRRRTLIGFEVHGHQQAAARTSIHSVRSSTAIAKRHLRVV